MQPHHLILHPLYLGIEVSYKRSKKLHDITFLYPYHVKNSSCIYIRHVQDSDIIAMYTNNAVRQYDHTWLQGTNNFASDIIGACPYHIDDAIVEFLAEGYVEVYVSQ